MKIEKIRTGKWADDIATAEEFKGAVNKISEAVNRYGWGKKVVFPYGWETTLEEFITEHDIDDFDRYTISSKRALIAEVNGLIGILNVWLEREEEPKVAVMLKSGKIKNIPESDVEDYVLMGATII